MVYNYWGNQKVRHSEASQLAFNEFQKNSSDKNPLGYLPGIFKDSKKLINFWIVSLSRTSLVFKTFNNLNIFLIIVIFALSVFGLRTWLYPQYPNQVDALNLAGNKRELAPLVIARKNQPYKSINEVVNNNLFRKERDEYNEPPVEHKTNNEFNQIPEKPSLPAPKLILRGVMLLNDTKIAILEGYYSVITGGKTENKTIKRKGYYLGEQIGDYKIKQIEKKAITLNNPLGQILKVKLVRRVPNIDKPKIKKQPKIISTRPKIKSKLQPRKHISGGLTSPVPAPRHISGR